MLSRDIWKLYENLVFLELKRRGKKINYWKNKKEGDDVLKKGNKWNEYIQVCSNLDEQNKDRELVGILEAMQEINLKKCLIITKDY